MNIRKSASRKGFTLLEILLVVAAIGILAGIVIVAINPAKQLGDARDAQRRSDINALLNAVHQYAIDNNGNYPSGIDSLTNSVQVFGTAGSGADATCTATSTVSLPVNLTVALTPTYIVGIPMDPSSGTTENTDYYINKLTGGRIVVGACDPEQASAISIIR